MNGHKNSGGKPPPRNDPSQSNRLEDTPRSPRFNFPPSSSSSADSFSSKGPTDPPPTLSDDAPQGTGSKEEKTVPAFTCQTSMTTTPMDVSNSVRTTDNLPEREVSTMSRPFDMPALLMKVIPSSEFMGQESIINTSSSPVDGPSRNTSLHAHFGSDLDITPSAESNAAHLPDAPERNVLLFPQLSQTRSPFDVEAASQQKPRASEHETATTHSVRSTTIPSVLPPQPSHPEEVFSEPHPFSQIYPPRQHCESRSCAMRRSAFNDMTCNMITSSSPASDSDPPSPAAYPTEPVLVEMSSEDQNSSIHSDCFLNVSAWNEQSTLPATTTPSGQSNNSEDIISCFESPDALRILPPATSKVATSPEPPTSTPEQDPTTKSDATSHHSASDEVLVALLSPLTGNVSASEASGLEEDNAPNLNFYAPSSDSEPTNQAALQRNQSLKGDESKPGKDQQKVINTTNDPIPGPSSALDRENKMGELPVEDRGRSRVSPAPAIEVDVSQKFVSSLLLSVPTSLYQIEKREMSRTQPPSARRFSSSESSNLQSSTENTDNDQTSANEQPRTRSRSNKKTDSDRGTNNPPKP